MLCTPCLERANREREAYRVVDGEGFCFECYTGRSEWDKESIGESLRNGWSHREYTHRGARGLK